MSQWVKKYSNQETNRLTREAICTALLILMKEHSFSQISITELVRKAGVSRTAYYSNYSSKQDILFDLVDSLIDSLNNELLPYSDVLTGKAKYPRKFIYLMLEHFDRNRSIYQTLYEAHFNHIILERLNESMISRMPVETTEQLYRIYFNAGAIYNMLSRWIQGIDHLSLEQMTDICLKIYTTPMSASDLE